MALWDRRQALCSTVRQPRFILNVSVTCCIPHVFPPTALRRLRFPLSVILPGSPSFTRCQREHLAVRLLLTFHSRCCGALSAPGGQPRAKEPPLPPGPPPGEKARPELTRLQSKSKEIGHRNEGITKRCFLCKGRRACPSWPEHRSQEGGLTEGVLNMQAARSPRCSGRLPLSSQAQETRAGRRPTNTLLTTLTPARPGPPVSGGDHSKACAGCLHLRPEAKHPTEDLKKPSAQQDDGGFTSSARICSLSDVTSG